MKDRVAFVIMEDDNGNFGFQSYGNPESAEESFRNMKGKPGQQPMRASFIVANYMGKPCQIEKFETKILPVPQDSHSSWVLGEGPVVVEPDGLRRVE